MGFVWCDLSFFPSLVPLRVCDLRLHFCCFFTVICAFEPSPKIKDLQPFQFGTSGNDPVDTLAALG